MTDGRHIPLSQDAALVVALAGTAIPFAHSAEDEAERWLRAMRLHGQVGSMLQATERAERFAISREAETVGTPDILFAVLDVYDKLFDRALYMRGTSREELVERLTAASAAGRR